MLGALRKDTGWHWGASGKHPVAKDYISIGQQTESMAFLSGLVEKGYSAMNEKVPEQHSWRFVLRGGKKGMLACGIIRDSMDSIGRQYPFIVAGEGRLPGWEDRWDEVFSWLGPLFSQMEYMLAKRVASLDELKACISRFSEPALKDIRIPEGGRHSAADGEGGFVELLDGDDDDLERQVGAHLLKLMKKDPVAPSAVFVGGTSQRSRMCVFRGHLAVNDIRKLWRDP